jgi:hypothetical protein
MNEYNREQFEAVVMVQKQINALTAHERRRLKTRIGSYLDFRKDVDRFMEHYFSGLCTQMCYQDRYSACCNREGILTFFADVVINLLVSKGQDADRLLRALCEPNNNTKCVYLGRAGCLWRVKPIVCEMFLCERAKNAVFSDFPHAMTIWEELKRREKRYTWPDRTVLFDELEGYFMEKGCDSQLMYCHKSPGLLRVKALARSGLKSTRASEARHGE